MAFRWSKQNSGDIIPIYRLFPALADSASIEQVRELDYVLTPGRYVGLPQHEDDFDFVERYTALKAEFEAQIREEESLNLLSWKILGELRWWMAKIEVKGTEITVYSHSDEDYICITDIARHKNAERTDDLIHVSDRFFVEKILIH